MNMVSLLTQYYFLEHSQSRTPELNEQILENRQQDFYMDIGLDDLRSTFTAVSKPITWVFGISVAHAEESDSSVELRKIIEHELDDPCKDMPGSCNEEGDVDTDSDTDSDTGNDTDTDTDTDHGGGGKNDNVFQRCQEMTSVEKSMSPWCDEKFFNDDGSFSLDKAEKYIKEASKNAIDDVSNDFGLSSEEYKIAIQALETGNVSLLNTISNPIAKKSIEVIVKGYESGVNEAIGVAISYENLLNMASQVPEGPSVSAASSSNIPEQTVNTTTTIQQDLTPEQKAALELMQNPNDVDDVLLNAALQEYKKLEAEGQRMSQGELTQHQKETLAKYNQIEKDNLPLEHMASILTSFIPGSVYFEWAVIVGDLIDDGATDEEIVNAIVAGTDMYINKKLKAAGFKVDTYALAKQATSLIGENLAVVKDPEYKNQLNRNTAALEEAQKAIHKEANLEDYIPSEKYPYKAKCEVYLHKGICYRVHYDRARKAIELIPQFNGMCEMF